MGQKIPDTLYDAARKRYLEGDETYTDLAAAFGVAAETLGRRAKKEGWAILRQQARDAALDEAQQYTVRKFAKLGLPPEKIIRKVVELIDSENPAFVDKGIQRYLDMTGQRIARTDGEGASQTFNGPILILPDNGRD
jgi:hypothetical protein